MTELLFMNDFGVESCDATVVSIQNTEDGCVDIETDKTCFYPRGGGQDWDTGTIESTNAMFEVDEVRLDEHGIVHHIGVFRKDIISKGDQVNCKVSQERRDINTRLHSAGHVIDMAIDSIGLDWVATKGQHYPHLCAVEYSGTWNADKAEETRVSIESGANEIIQSDKTNSIVFMPVEEMHAVVRHVPENIPRNKPARVVMYGEDFGIPCGGTNVGNLNQIGVVVVSKIKMKKDVIRVNYSVLGVN